MRFRLMSMRTACLAGAAALVLTAAAACSSGGGSASSSPTVQTSNSSIKAPPAKAGGSLTVLEGKGFSGDWPLGFDPATNTTGSADQDYYNAVYGQLFHAGCSSRIFFACVAESPTRFAAARKRWNRSASGFEIEALEIEMFAIEVFMVEDPAL